jgi:hypothetical protein
MNFFNLLLSIQGGLVNKNFIACLFRGVLMVKYRLVFLSLVFFMMIPLSTALSQTNEDPKIVFDARDVDLGTVMEGENIKHTFKVFNHGEKLLQIKRVSPG